MDVEEFWVVVIVGDIGYGFEGLKKFIRFVSGSYVELMGVFVYEICNVGGLDVIIYICLDDCY